ncbi:MAG: hypothetical protein AAF722_11090 [Cyanobacteria bacterium P01_C01_bin.70]
MHGSLTNPDGLSTKSNGDSRKALSDMSDRPLPRSPFPTGVRITDYRSWKAH